MWRLFELMPNVAPASALKLKIIGGEKGLTLVYAVKGDSA